MTPDQEKQIFEAFSEATFGIDDLNDEEERLLFFLIEDRHELGTLEHDPVTSRDIATVKTWGLIGRMTRGDDLTIEERKFAGRLLSNILPEFMQKVSEKFRRLDASKRGGAAGRIAKPGEIMKVWDGYFAASGKRTWADDETAKSKSLSARTVRRIRTELGRK